MKKLTSILVLSMMMVFALSSCNQYRSISSATKISQLSGNPFYHNLSKNLLKNVGSFLVTNGIKPESKMNLLTPISSVIKTTEQISSFKNMLSTAYQIYPKKLDQQFGNVGNMRDLIYFVANNGRNFNFSK